MIAHRFVVPLFGVLLASCAVGPDYQRPAVDLPGQFAGLPAGNADAASLAKQNWREVFADPALRQLIDEALTAGPDALLAAARIREAEAMAGVSRAPLYPQASLNWMPSERHILQLNFSSDKEYPAYWEMQGAISYIDGYSEIHGTPGLRPSRSYEAQAVYIYRQKYIFVLFWNERPDYFTQAAWQASDRLAMIYQSLNWNFNRQWGANAVIPFRAGKWLNSRLTLTGMRMRQKCDPFHDMSFDRAKWVGIARLVNTFHLSRKPAIDLEVNGFFQSGAIQGTFDINPLGSADAAVKWTFDRGRATLSVRCNDLFDSGAPSTKVRYRGQWLDMGAQRYTRTATVHFSYRFGGYKAKKHKEVDTSRFGH